MERGDLEISCNGIYRTVPGMASEGGLVFRNVDLRLKGLYLLLLRGRWYVCMSVSLFR